MVKCIKLTCTFNKKGICTDRPSDVKMRGCNRTERRVLRSANIDFDISLPFDDLGDEQEDTDTFVTFGAGEPDPCECERCEEIGGCDGDCGCNDD